MNKPAPKISSTPSVEDQPGSDKEAIAGAPPGTTAGQSTTEVDDPSDTDPKQFEQGKKARRDAESEQVDTDCYNTSGNHGKPPKTSGH
tara:strand:+ start:427 stop:690 length:264 start_codon:yes stop_codon:yes gene_type:complete